jgi:hypothetical protein
MDVMPPEEHITMPTTVAGIYKEGNVQLLSTPTGVREGPVLVTLEEIAAPKPEPCPLPYGLYAQGRESTEEDFKIAEWRGENETGNESIGLI